MIGRKSRLFAACLWPLAIAPWCVARDASPAPAPENAFVNPHVSPGKVRWHPSFAAACEAAKKSGRPVLLFHMMGRLDEQFC